MLAAIQKSGLTEKEAQIYLATLELGTALASTIARKAGVNRLTTYGILQTLAERGYVALQQKGRGKSSVREFSAVHPRVLLNDVEQSYRDLEANFPQLLTLFQLHNNRPKISFYEGQAGIQTLWNLSLTCQEKKVYQIAHYQTMLEIAGRDFVWQYVQQRVEKGIQNFCLDDPESRKNLQSDYPVGTNPALLRESRLAPAGLIASGITIIYDNKVSFMSSRKESFGFLIESTEFTTLIKSLFQIVWQISQSDVANKL